MTQRWLTTKKTGNPCVSAARPVRAPNRPMAAHNKCWKDGGKIHRRGGRQPLHRISRESTSGEGTRKVVAHGLATREAAIDAALHSVLGDYPDAELNRVFEFRNRNVHYRFAWHDLNGRGIKTFRPVHLHKNEWRQGAPFGKLPLYRINEFRRPARYTAWRAKRRAMQREGSG